LNITIVMFIKVWLDECYPGMIIF